MVDNRLLKQFFSLFKEASDAIKPGNSLRGRLEVASNRIVDPIRGGLKDVGDEEILVSISELEAILRENKSNNGLFGKIFGGGQGNPKDPNLEEYYRRKEEFEREIHLLIRLGNSLQYDAAQLVLNDAEEQLRSGEITAEQATAKLNDAIKHFSPQNVAGREKNYTQGLTSEKKLEELQKEVTESALEIRAPDGTVLNPKKGADERSRAMAAFQETLSWVDKHIDSQNPDREYVDHICNLLQKNLHTWSATDIRQATADLKAVMKSAPKETEGRRVLDEYNRLKNESFITQQRYPKGSEYGSNYLSRKVFTKGHIDSLGIDESDKSSLKRGISELESQVVRGLDGNAIRKMHAGEIEADRNAREERHKKYYEQTPEVGSDMWAGFVGLSKINKNLRDLDKHHKESWEKEREARAKKIKELLNKRARLINQLKAEGLNERAVVNLRQQILSINEQLDELTGGNLSIVGINDVRDLLSPGKTDIDASALEKHLNENIFDKGKYESEHLHERRKLEKKHGIKRGEMHDASFDMLPGLGSFIGLGEETASGVLVNIFAFLVTVWIVIYGIVGPVVETFAFFIPFLSILKYPIYVIGILIFYQFVKEIFEPFKEDFSAIGHHHKKSADDVPGMIVSMVKSPKPKEAGKDEGGEEEETE